MGVLGWPPSVAMREASVEDLADAYEGYVAMRGLSAAEKAALPPVSFMGEMMNRFPDGKERKK